MMSLKQASNPNCVSYVNDRSSSINPEGLPDMILLHSSTGRPYTKRQRDFLLSRVSTKALFNFEQNTVGLLEHHKDTCSEDMTRLLEKIHKLRLY